MDADVVITTDAVEEIPSVKASARDTGRATMMHCGTAAACGGGCGGGRDGGGCGGSGCGGGRDGGCGGPDGGCGGMQLAHILSCLSRYDRALSSTDLHRQV